jgi:hypothetical protein
VNEGDVGESDLVRVVLGDANVLYQRLRGFSLPDEEDRHVLAAAIAAEATVPCTANTKDFPESVTASLGVEMMTPDGLLCLLITEFEPPDARRSRRGRRQLAHSDRRVDHPRASPSGSARSCGADGRSA